MHHGGEGLAASQSFVVRAFTHRLNQLANGSFAKEKNAGLSQMPCFSGTVPSNFGVTQTLELSPNSMEVHVDDNTSSGFIYHSLIGSNDGSH